MTSLVSFEFRLSRNYQKSQKRCELICDDPQDCHFTENGYDNGYIES